MTCAPVALRVCLPTSLNKHWSLPFPCSDIFGENRVLEFLHLIPFVMDCCNGLCFSFVDRFVPCTFLFSSLFANIGWDSRVIIMIYFLCDSLCVCTNMDKGRVMIQDSSGNPLVG